MVAPSSHKRKVEAAGYAPTSTLSSNQLEPALHQLEPALSASYDLKPATYELEPALSASYELERKLSASYDVSATYQPAAAGQYQLEGAGQYQPAAGQYQPAAASKYQLGGGGLPEPYPPDWPQIDRCDTEPHHGSVSR